jgi:hypothetical protein
MLIFLTFVMGKTVSRLGSIKGIKEDDGEHKQRKHSMRDCMHDTLSLLFTWKLLIAVMNLVSR